MAMKAAIAANGASALPARYPPCSDMIDAPTTQAIAMMVVADKSICATIRTSISPIAAMNSGSTWRKMSSRLVGLTISGTKGQTAAI